MMSSDSLAGKFAELGPVVLVCFFKVGVFYKDKFFCGAKGMEFGA
jgi:hypothetical protein